MLMFCVCVFENVNAICLLYPQSHPWSYFADRLAAVAPAIDCTPSSCGSSCCYSCPPTRALSGPILVGLARRLDSTSRRSLDCLCGRLGIACIVLAAVHRCLEGDRVDGYAASKTAATSGTASMPAPGIAVFPRPMVMAASAPSTRSQIGNPQTVVARTAIK